MTTETKKLSLKLLIDKKSNKVLYAEAGKDVVDFLFGLLALPLGRVTSLLSKQGMAGCVAELHKSLDQLDSSYIVSDQTKCALLTPPDASSSSQVFNPALLLGPSSTTTATKKFYTCSEDCWQKFSEDHGVQCPTCKRGKMTREVELLSSTTSKKQKILNSEEVDAGGAEGGCVKGVVTYSVMDDLTVVPMSTISSITLLNKFQIKDLTALEEKSVVLGNEEALGLLKASLKSKSVLTDVFLPNN